MRVGFNARLLASPDLRGWNRYTVNLLAELPALGVEPVLYSDRPIHPGHLARLPEGGFEVRLGAVRPYVAWEQVWLPRAAGRDRVAVLHAPANFGLPWSCPCPRVLTLHDAIDQVYYAPRLRPAERWRPGAVISRVEHWLARTAAERVITVSAHARSDLVGALGLPSEKVRAIHNAADPAFAGPVPPDRRSDVRARHGLTRPYVFYVGGWEGRKNVPFLVRAFAAAGVPGLDLVLAGGSGPLRDELAALADRLGVADRVRLLGWVEEADLPALYAEAVAFACPSEYEGFGLQLVEAMAAGCPVLAARASSLPEVLGDGGETFALGDPAELSALIRRVAAEPSFRADLNARAGARGAAFSWGRTAALTVAVYRELTGRPAAPSAPRRGLETPCASAARS